jgi:meiotic recombination protein SPO11
MINKLCSKEIHTTKRDIFYHVELFKKQEDSDSVLDDICCMMGCTRCNLFVVADERAVVVGQLSFEDNGDMMDC